MKFRIMIAALLPSVFFAVFLGSCASQKNDGTLAVVATSTMIVDLVREIGGDKVEVLGLMQTGVDPHLYQPKESDITTLQEADLVIFNGVGLEAKLGEIFARIDNTVSLENALEPGDVLNDGEGGRDPHIWFSVALWKKAAGEVARGLHEKDPANASFYEANLQRYLKELDDLQTYISSRVAEIDPSQRILITAHDAFAYFAHSNGFKVKAIQGISTEAEASTSDIRELAEFIAENKINAIFTESSVSPKTIESLQKATEARGFPVGLGKELYSDSLKQDTSYLVTYRLNIDAIVDALK